MAYKDPLERQAAVESLAESRFRKLQKERPDLVEKYGRDNVLSDLRMEAGMSLPLDEQSEAELGPELARQEKERQAALDAGLDPEELRDPKEQERRLLNRESQEP